MSTYSAKPFISKDGVDENGIRAEVKVVLGYGNVKDIESSAAGKAFKVIFEVDNSKFDSSGWTQKDSNVHKKILEAQEAGEPIHFRIETRRKPGIDRTTPIAELGGLANAKDSIVKSLAAVRREGEESWTVSQQAVTNMAEDPKGGSGLYSANDMAPEELGNRAQAAPSNDGSFESTPYYLHNRDGGLNPGSIAVSVPISFLSFLAEWDRDHDDLAQVGDKKRPVVAKLLLAASNELQLKIYEGKLEKPDLNAGSHTRARALVFETIRSYHPITNEVLKDKDSMIAWKESIVEKASGIWSWSMREVENLLK